MESRVQFDDPTLLTALALWRSMPSLRERAEADNMLFEPRVSVARQAAFATFAASAPLSAAQILYCKKLVEVVGLPHSFQTDLEPAWVGEIDTEQYLFRLVGLERVLKEQTLTFAELAEAHAAEDSPFIDRFLETWNTSDKHDDRPAFATFATDATVRAAIEAPDWPEQLRDRLGLGHHTCEKGPIPVALMRYLVKEVLAAGTRAGTQNAITVPTVLDQPPNPFYFPAPASLPCGRTMALVSTYDEALLVAEVIHVRLPYKRAHLHRLGEIRRPPVDAHLPDLRNNHLGLLHLLAGDESFGEMMPA